MYRKIYYHANSIRVMMMMMMIAQLDDCGFKNADLRLVVHKNK